MKENNVDFKRKKGYYWVQTKFGYWDIARFVSVLEADCYVWVIWTLDGNDYYNDSDFLKIDEKKINQRRHTY